MQRLLATIAGVAPVGLLCLTGAVLLAGTASAGVYHVSPQGDDAQEGCAARPWATLRRAAEAMKPGDTCVLREGVFRETLRPVRSGEPGRPMVFRNHPGETATLSGTAIVDGWQREADGLWSAPLDWTPEDQWQLFIGDQPLDEARWPKAGGDRFRPRRATAEGGTVTTLTDSAIPGDDKAWAGAVLWCAGGSQWIHWSARVTGYNAATHTLTFEPPPYGFFERAARPQQGSYYALIGARAALTAPGEWWYDAAAGRVWLLPPEGVAPTDGMIEARRRAYVIDLASRSHIQITGLHLRAGGIQMDKDSSDLVLESLHGRHIGHSWRQDLGSRAAAIHIRGRRVQLKHSDIAIGSGTLLQVEGEDHVVFNNHIHQGNYGAGWGAVLSLAGRRHHVAFNTVAHSGRDVIRPAQLGESIVEYNDISDAGYLAKDLGLTYGHTTDYMNTVLRFNHLHDTHAEGVDMGIYFDHMALNVIVHNNLIWNTGFDPIRINNPGYLNLVYNNSAWRTGQMRTFDQDSRNALYGCRYVNNIFNQPVKLPGSVHLDGNLVAAEPFTSPEAGDFTLLTPEPGVRLAGVPGADGPDPVVGAVPRGTAVWKAGHDFANPPTLPPWNPPRVAWMNLVRNASFEWDMLEGWEVSAPERASIVEGNAWGSRTNHRGRGSQPTGTGRGELRLGPGEAEIAQTITGLTPDADHILSVWMHVEEPGTRIALAVATKGRPEAAADTDSTAWVRLELPFRTGPATDTVTIHIRATGPGHARADNIGLPWNPPFNTLPGRPL